MDILFLGATQTVTGSKFLLQCGTKKILVDCGLYQGLKALRLKNWENFPIHPHDINAVILTHAHIDHTGYLPRLIKQGFKGNIYCTTGTRDLCAILLPDSGHIQEEEAHFANKHGYSKHHPALPLYTAHEAELALKQFHTIPYDDSFTLFNEITVTFRRAGHIIGSSIVQIKYKNTVISFSGDLGRLYDPMLKEPEIIRRSDYLVLESTYGDRLHEKELPTVLLAKVINDTVKHGGSVIIPSFTVGRAQNILYYLYLLKKQNKIPDIPVFLDSPMAINVNHLLTKHLNELKISKRECEDICRIATYVNTPEASKKCDNYHYPIILISASGMATGGRILHHLKIFGPEPQHTILFTGYQANGTRGARIINGEPAVKIHGIMVPIRAKVKVLENTSAHADYDEILRWLAHFEKPPRKTFIVHGESGSADALKDKIETTLGWDVVVPHYFQNEKLL